MSIFNVSDFGAVGDGVQDDFPAFQEALDAIDAAAGNETIRGAILFVPSGKYRMSQTLKITRSIVLHGAGMHSSILEFVSPTNTPLAGIIVDKGGHPSGLETLPLRAIIRGLGIQTPKSFTPDHPPSTPVDDDATLLNGTSSGVVLYQLASVEKCYVGGFEHDGIHINTSNGSGRNADTWQVRDCFVQMNGRHGLFVTGHDSNGGCALNLYSQTNCRWGFFDQSQAGNTYVACVAEANGHINQGPEDPRPSFGGAYRTLNAGNHVLLGCNAELGQISRLTSPTMVLGGNHGDEIKIDRLLFAPTLIRYHSAEMDNLRTNGPIHTSVTPRAVVSDLHPQPIDSNQSVILVNAKVPSVAIPGGFGFAPVPLTLPPLHDPQGRLDPLMQGRRYTIKRIDDATIPTIPDRLVPVTILVAPGEPETIDGATSVELVKPFAWVTLLAGVKSTQLADEPNWYIIGRGAA